MLIAVTESYISPAVVARDKDHPTLNLGSGTARIAQVKGNDLVADLESAQIVNVSSKGIERGTFVKLEPMHFNAMIDGSRIRGDKTLFIATPL